MSSGIGSSSNFCTTETVGRELSFLSRLNVGFTNKAASTLTNATPASTIKQMNPPVLGAPLSSNDDKTDEVMSLKFKISH